MHDTTSRWILLQEAIVNMLCCSLTREAAGAAGAPLQLRGVLRRDAHGRALLGDMRRVHCKGALLPLAVR